MRWPWVSRAVYEQVREDRDFYRAQVLAASRAASVPPVAGPVEEPWPAVEAAIVARAGTRRELRDHLRLYAAEQRAAGAPAALVLARVVHWSQPTPDVPTAADRQAAEATVAELLDGVD